LPFKRGGGAVIGFGDEVWTGVENGWLKVVFQITSNGSLKPKPQNTKVYTSF
jgi:hypothetical protein